MMATTTRSARPSRSCAASTSLRSASGRSGRRLGRARYPATTPCALREVVDEAATQEDEEEASALPEYVFFSEEDLSRDMPPSRVVGGGTGGSLLEKIFALEKRALELQCNASAERRQRQLLGEISCLEREALALQCARSAAEGQRKLLAEISEVEKKALALQYVAGSLQHNPQLEGFVGALQAVSSEEKRALDHQCTTSALARQRSALGEVSEGERKALETQVAPEAAAEESSPTTTTKKKFRSSWDAASDKVGKYKKEGADYLYELGASDDTNLNIDVGQTSMYIDKKFTLGDGGLRADIADGSLRKFEFRKFENIKGDYWIPKEFQDKLTLHITKNYLEDLTDYMPNCPLVLGIFGGKGQGKSFLTELVLKRLKAQAVIMSAGELEDEIAGRPAKLIRERYRKAADMSKARGVLTCLVINDLDAGVGNFRETQNTVNSQMVVGTLMNLCDDPKRVSVGQDWRGKDVIRRVPIIITANDLNTIYAPLLRDGRMEKYNWKPSRKDIFEMVYTMFRDDDVSPEEVQYVIDSFPNQGLDFFGALKARMADSEVRMRMEAYDGKVEGYEGTPLPKGPPGYLRLLMKDLRDGENREGDSIKIEVSLEKLLEEGKSLAQEQEYVNQIRLAGEYLKNNDDE
ncbi:AAA ATPase domain-containing protein [Chloropicon primus]|uniref:Ribulose bisphosphate carboxylase/oxygenase activase, chloroplastic n=2 Tax=Chloropicon primus TaxID=1764295 RepID=A0A5B8MMI8_9CHLO|nr:hypothetical protein A3770_06p43860 [Chloropicon primus]UPR01088.1 AAA ATPase domain-containing protein [Chloropicon primus]|eukprot:QDZ21868.1 hypothetical protein A3770_06p43860 [Chloropicon primus]